MRLTAEVAALVEELNQWVVSLVDLPIDQARKAYIQRIERASGEPVAMAAVADQSADLAGRTLTLRSYRPQGVATAAAPALVYFHGGGWVLGDLDSHDLICRQLAARCRCVLIAVDYRLAPEYPLPAAAEDAIDVLVWIVAHAAALGVDSERLAVGGDSAGGHLTAVAALAARDRDIRLRAQVLVYPLVDMRKTAQGYPSRTRNAHFPPLTNDLMAFFARHTASRIPTDDWRLSPLWAENLGGVAPALVVTAGADILMDEGVLYAHWLQEAGGVVEHAHYPGVVHGFLEMAGQLTVTGEAMDRIAATVRARLG